MIELVQTSPDPAATCREHRSTEHAVFALTPEEKRLFFASDPCLSRSGIRESWVDPSRLDLADWEKMLRGLGPTILVTAWGCPPLPLDWGLEGCPLRYVCSITGSVKPRVPRELIERGLLVTNWGSMASRAVAEHALLLVLALLRGMPRWPELMRTPHTMFEMMPLIRSRPLQGRRVGLHGFGAVARHLVSLLQPYAVKLAAFSPGVPSTMMTAVGVRPCSSLAELFSGSEVLIECEGLNVHSRGAVTAEILALLPEDAVFVNVGRGAVVDEEALAALAQGGRLRVGLDVVQNEPLSRDSPLFGADNVVLSPHVAGPTWETYPLCGAQALDNVEIYLRGEAPKHRVTLEIYDRAT